jgi:hypothetical protein
MTFPHETALALAMRRVLFGVPKVALQNAPNSKLSKHVSLLSATCCTYIIWTYLSGLSPQATNKVAVNFSMGDHHYPQTLVFRLRFAHPSLSIASRRRVQTASRPASRFHSNTVASPRQCLWQKNTLAGEHRSVWESLSEHGRPWGCVRQVPGARSE